MENSDLLNRIQGLLNKAASTDSEAEAEALTAKATLLMERYSIDAAILAAKAKRSDKPVKYVLPTPGVYLKATQNLANQIANAFGAHVVFTQVKNPETDNWDEVVEIFGYETDIELIVLLYTSLQLQCANLAQHVKGLSAGETRVMRKSFIYGFGNKIGERLQEQRKTVTVEAEDTAPGAALVLVDRSVLARKLLDEEYPRIKPRKTKTTIDTYSYGDGYRAGAKADLHNVKQTGQTRRAALV